MSVPLTFPLIISLISFDYLIQFLIQFFLLLWFQFILLIQIVQSQGFFNQISFTNTNYFILILQARSLNYFLISSILLLFYLINYNLL